MTDRPKVLWLARHIPVPFNTGDRIYTGRLVEALGQAGADVHYLGLANPEYPDMGAEILDPVVRWEIVPGRPTGIVRAMMSSRPVVGARFGTPAFEARMVELLRANAYDAVVVDQHGLAWTLPFIEELTAAYRPVVVHIGHDFETDVYREIARAYRGNPVRRLALHLNAHRTAVAEHAAAMRSHLIVTLTEKDKILFQGLGTKAEFIVIPPGYEGPRRPERVITAATPRHVAIVGSYGWTAKQMNLAAFLEAADPILAQAGIAVSVVGNAPDDFKAQWEGRLKASRFLGFVDDLGDFLDGCRMGLVVETIGGGFKLKVLDYAFTRTPVGALRPALEGQSPDVIADFLVADNEAELAHGIVALIDDIDRLNAMHEIAYRAAAPRYEWRRNGENLLEAIRNCRR